MRPHGGVVPRFITGLTSITTEMIREAPPIEQVLPQFREFMGDRVMVAHNVAFDFGFLDFEYRRIFGIGLANPVLCTLRMARRFMLLLKRRRLDLLAEHFDSRKKGTASRPRRRADGGGDSLDFSRDGRRDDGITRLDCLFFTTIIAESPARRIERHVPPEEIAALPHAPGVYMMRNDRGDLLYIGKARRFRERVSSYFLASVCARRRTWSRTFTKSRRERPARRSRRRSTRRA